VNDAADVSGRLFIRADHVIDDEVTRVERISDTVELVSLDQFAKFKLSWRHYG
jgi:hypothetical protein